uniref:hypothetical protein n=1 Tax=Burkholderia arboris TaxID=488730 RepID=UPI003BEEF437
MTRRTSTRRRPRGQLRKRLLLPLPREEIEQMSLQYHAALEAIRMKQGSAHGMRILLQMIILTGFIDDARRQDIRADVLTAAERGILVAFERGERESVWTFDESTDELVATLLAWHDDQLCTAPLAVLMEAIERVGRMTEGKSYERPPIRFTP